MRWEAIFINIECKAWSIYCKWINKMIFDDFIDKQKPLFRATFFITLRICLWFFFRIYHSQAIKLNRNQNAFSTIWLKWSNRGCLARKNRMRSYFVHHFLAARCLIKEVIYWIKRTRILFNFWHKFPYRKQKLWRKINGTTLN